MGTHLALDVTAGLATLLLAGVAVPVLRILGYSWDVAWMMLANEGIAYVGYGIGTLHKVS